MVIYGQVGLKIKQNMEIPVTIITKPIVNKLIALQSFFFARPRIDIDLVNHPENLSVRNH